MNKTAIEWTDVTWNPTSGCRKISPGCKNCYAKRLWPRVYPDRPFEYVREHPDRLPQPLRMRQPKRIFVDSMSDLFIDAVSFSFIDHVFAIMALTPQHTYQILTKRPERMLQYMEALMSGRRLVIECARWAGKNDRDRKDVARQKVRVQKAMAAFGANIEEAPREPLRNVYLGVSAENQETYNERAEILARTPAAIRFISFEPLLESIDPGNGFDSPPTFDGPYYDIHLAIVGGEAGRGARPMDWEWPIDIYYATRAAGKAFFMKQGSQATDGKKYKDFDSFPELLRVREQPIYDGPDRLPRIMKLA